MRKSIGTLFIAGLVVYLVSRGAVVVRPRETGEAIGVLVEALLRACSSAPARSSLDHGRSLEEGRKRDLVGVGERHQGAEGGVRLPALDHPQVLGMQGSPLRCSFLCEPSFFPELSEAQAEGLAGLGDGSLDRRSRPDLRRSVASVGR